MMLVECIWRVISGDISVGVAYEDNSPEIITNFVPVSQHDYPAGSQTKEVLNTIFALNVQMFKYSYTYINKKYIIRYMEI